MIDSTNDSHKTESKQPRFVIWMFSEASNAWQVAVGPGETGLLLSFHGTLLCRCAIDVGVQCITQEFLTLSKWDLCCMALPDSFKCPGHI